MHRWIVIAVLLVAAPSTEVAAWFRQTAVRPAGSGRNPAPAREGLAPLPGVRLWFRDSGGRGEAVIFLHAATGTADSWVSQVPAFTKAGYRVIVYDRRGFGRSVEDGSQPGHGTGADDLDSLVAYLGIDRFHLVSTAAGAMVGLDYAAAFPQRLRSMVIANTMGAIREAEFTAIGRRIRPPQFGELPPEYKELSPSYHATDPEGVKRWLAIEGSNHPNGAVTQGYRTEMTFAVMERMAVPALFISGEADPYMPPPVMRIMASHVPGAGTLVIPETSHSAFWEQPDLFNQHVLAFIGRH